MRSVLTATQNGEFIIFYDLYDTLYFTECARVSHLMRLMGNFIRQIILHRNGYVLPSFHHIYTFMHTSASSSFHSASSSSFSFFYSYSKHKKSGKMCVMPCINFVIFYHKFTHLLLRCTLLFGNCWVNFVRFFFLLSRLCRLR